MIAEYGAEHAPPPWQTFTIPNDIKDGNLHFVQKVFEGAFEVNRARPTAHEVILNPGSLMSYTLLAPQHQ